MSGYFRAPLAIGISHRPSPDDLQTGPSTRSCLRAQSDGRRQLLQLCLHARCRSRTGSSSSFMRKKKHVEAVVGWMGYWLQGARLPQPRCRLGAGHGLPHARHGLRAWRHQAQHRGDRSAACGRSSATSQSTTPSRSGGFARSGEQLKLTVPVTPMRQRDCCRRASAPVETAASSIR